MRLIIEDDEGHKTVVPFQRDEVTIGRDEGNTVRLGERNVSRRHARLLRVEGAVRVEDLQSYNGVRVNGERVHGSREVHAGDVLQIGDYDLALERDVQPESSPSLLLDDTSPSIPVAPPSPVAAPHPPAPRNLVREIRPVPEGERPRLFILGVPTPGREIGLPRTVVQIGRAPECDVSVDHGSLARTHAQIVREADGWKVVEVSAMHAVRLNGTPCTEAVLHDGDVVSLGEVQFRFVAPGAAYTFVPAPDDVRTKPSMRAVPVGGRPRRVWPLAVIVALVIAVGLAVLLFFARGAAAPVPKPEISVNRAPPPPARVEPGSSDLAESERELTAGHFASALQAAERAAAAGQAGKAAPLMERARSEQSAEKAVADARQAVAAGKNEQALDLVAWIPAASASAGGADDIRARAGAPFVKDRLAEAHRLEKAGRLPEALAVVDLALQKTPADQDLSSERSALAAQMPPPTLSPAEQARRDFADGIKLVEQNQCKQAITFFERAALADPAMAEAHKQLGACYAQQGDGEKAALHYRKLLELQPDHPALEQIRTYLRNYQQNTAGAGADRSP